MSKIYRAFPELDGFPDSECERFVVAARAQRGNVDLVRVVMFFLAALVTYASMMSIIGPYIDQGLRSITTPQAFDQYAETLMYLVLVTAGPVLASLCSLILRDWLLRRAIFDRIHLARCLKCKFSLLGLPSANGQVRCPECGDMITLAEIGLKADDLLVRHSSAEPPEN